MRTILRRPRKVPILLFLSTGGRFRIIVVVVIVVVILVLVLVLVVVVTTTPFRFFNNTTS